MAIRFLTWNVNGLNSPQKRRKIFTYLKQYKNDIICLQETHIRLQDQKYLTNARLGLHYVAAAPEKKNGIVIYLKNDLITKLIEADDQGRFLAIEVLIKGEKTLIVGVYAPNQKQETFYRYLRSKMSTWDYKSCVMLGDWNGVIDVKKDKLRTKQDSFTRVRLPTSFYDLMEEWELKDVWRERNPTDLDFTFFSDRHQSFSRIDFILITNDLSPRVKMIKIFPRTLTDHSPVWLEMDYGRGPRRSWRLNENLFKYEENINECKKQLKEYFAMNMYKGTPMEMVWDASKAYMRGVLINLNNKFRKKQGEKRRALEEELKGKEQLLLKNPGDKKIKEAILLLKEQFKMIIADQTATNLQYAKYNTFCNANKPGRWLAYILRKKKSQRTIEKIKYKGTEVFQQDLIRKSFLEYYSGLYRADNIQDVDIDRYLLKQNVISISQEQREILTQIITTEEIISVFKELKLGKAPGTDGLTAVYYKKLQEDMVEPLRQLFNKIQQGGHVPPSWKTAFISVIPKEGQDNTDPKNYRPISLLNIDYKIFAKVLANRLMKVLQQTINHDQTGFLSGRQMKSNVRHIVNILEYLGSNNQVPAGLIFLDAEKAFDRLSWQFLIKLMEKMDLGDNFVQPIKAIYQKQTAQIIINGGLTDNFVIEKGTRQGCPLSPLLFIYSLEILLNNIRDSKEIQGVHIRQQEYKVRAFADDLVVTVTQPLKSVKVLVDTIKEYGLISGFKVNAAKTKIITKNMNVSQKQEMINITGFEIVKKVKYLGVNILTINSKLYQYNYELLWQKMKLELQSWRKLQLSLLGRIAAIKMNLLPRFLFLFQTIPILKTEKNLKEWQRDINAFVWAGKKPRVKQKIMQDSRERGGLKLPNLGLYYDAAVLTIVSDWLKVTEDRILNVEGYGLVFGWHAYLLYDKKVDVIFKSHILRSSLLRVWKKYSYILDNKIPIWTRPRHMIQNINIEQNQDCITYEQLLDKEGYVYRLKTMQQLKEAKVIKTWFQYSQIQTKWKEDQKKGILQKEDSLIKQIRDQSQMHIKRIYNVLLERDSETELIKDCMIKWAQNVGGIITLETWENIWVRNVKFTQAQNLRENFYKMFYRWHLDPKKLACMYPNLQPKCWRCGSQDATYFHIWWTCPRIKPFWIKIWWILQNILKKKIKFMPQFFLLGIITDCTGIEMKLILNLITAARLLVAQYWKKEEIPTIQEWTIKVVHLAEMAKISAYLKDHSNEKYIKEWKRWIDYIQCKYRIKKVHLAYE